MLAHGALVTASYPRPSHALQQFYDIRAEAAGAVGHVSAVTRTGLSPPALPQRSGFRIYSWRRNLAVRIYGDDIPHSNLWKRNPAFRIYRDEIL